MSWSFSKLSDTSPTSQHILQHFRRFTYVTAHSPTLPLFHLRDIWFSNLSIASHTSQDLHLCHLACQPCSIVMINLQIEHMFCSSLFSNISDSSRTSELILQPFRHFTYVTAHSTTLPLLHLRPNSPNIPTLHQRHRSFSITSIALPTTQLILQPFRCFTYVRDYSVSLLSLLLRHSVFNYVTWRDSHAVSSLLIHNIGHTFWSNLFSKLSVTSPTSQLILQSFRRFTYVTAHSPILPLLLLRHNSFSNLSVTLPTSQLILQPFRRFTYVTVHSPTLPLLHLRNSSFSNPFFRFYVTGSSLTSSGEPPMSEKRTW